MWMHRHLSASALVSTLCLEGLCWHFFPSLLAFLNIHREIMRWLRHYQAWRGPNAEIIREQCWVWVKPFQMANILRDVMQTMCRFNKVQWHSILPVRTGAQHWEVRIHRKSSDEALRGLESPVVSRTKRPPDDGAKSALAQTHKSRTKTQGYPQDLVELYLHVSEGK